MRIEIRSHRAPSTAPRTTARAAVSVLIAAVAVGLALLSGGCDPGPGPDNLPPVMVHPS